MELMKPNLVVTDRDYQRLTSLIEWVDFDGIDLLWDELVRARVMPQREVPSDVVTMNSKVQVRDEENGQERELQVVYPYQADAAQGKVSILAPVGMALLGLKVGQVIAWPLPNGKHRKLKVLSIQFQPEAMGSYHL